MAGGAVQLPSFVGYCSAESEGAYREPSESPVNGALAGVNFMDARSWAVAHVAQAATSADALLAALSFKGE